MLNERTLPPLSGGKARHAVILLHGLGDSGAGLIGLGDCWSEGLPEAEFIAPDAPFPFDSAPFGRQWFSLQDRSPATLLDGVRRAAPLLDAFIDHVLSSRGLPAERVALAGDYFFSTMPVRDLIRAVSAEVPAEVPLEPGASIGKPAAQAGQVCGPGS